MSPGSPWPRRATRAIHLGPLAIGGGAPVSVQSMLTAPPKGQEAANELARLALAGCEAVRVALPDRGSIEGLGRLVASTPVPLVADVHFDWELGIEALEVAGVVGLRINPGTAGRSPPWKALGRAAEALGACIRVGANAASPSRAAREHPMGLSHGLVKDVLDATRRLAEAGAPHLKLSLKFSSLPELVAANRLLAEASEGLGLPPWPIHLGLTEAGPPPQGELKSAAALAILLAEGIGDTIRISLSADPVREVRAAHGLLRALGLGRRGVDLVSCPTCGRCRGDVIGLARALEAQLDDLEDRALDGLTLAVMGCEVNGPGEAGSADAGAAALGDGWLLFERGRPLGRVPEAEVVTRLLELARALAGAPLDPT